MNESDRMERISSFPRRVNEAVLLVQSYQEGVMSGQLIHPRMGRPKAIRSLSQLVLTLDEVFMQEDMVCFHAFDQFEFNKVPRIATLRINVLQQDHSSWQGIIQWEENRKEVTFDSVLELIRMIDELLAE